MFGGNAPRARAARQELLSRFLRIDLTNQEGQYWLLTVTKRLGFTMQRGGKLDLPVPPLAPHRRGTFARTFVKDHVVWQKTAVVVPGQEYGTDERDGSRASLSGPATWFSGPVPRSKFVGLYKEWQSALQHMDKLQWPRPRNKAEAIAAEGLALRLDQGLRDVQFSLRRAEGRALHMRLIDSILRSPPMPFPEFERARRPALKALREGLRTRRAQVPRTSAAALVFPPALGIWFRTLIGELCFAMLERIVTGMRACSVCGATAEGRRIVCAKATCRKRARADAEARRRSARFPTDRSRALGALRRRRAYWRARLSRRGLSRAARRRIVVRLNGIERQRRELE